MSTTTIASPCGDINMQDDFCSNHSALPSQKPDILPSFLINDGHFPDDVKLVIMSQYPSLKDLALAAKCNRNQRFLVPYAVDIRFMAMLRRYFGREGANIVRSYMRAHRILIAGSEGVRMAQGDPIRKTDEDREDVAQDHPTRETDEVREDGVQGDPARETNEARKDGVQGDPARETDEVREDGAQGDPAGETDKVDEDWEPDNLDFFVPVDESKGLEDELVGLGAEPVESAAPLTVTFRKATKSIKEFVLNGKTIYIHESISPRAALAVLDSWTTCTVVATADFLVALYPSHTLNNRATLQGHEYAFIGTEHLEKKYNARGIKHIAPHEAVGGAYCLADWATIGEASKVCVVPMHHANWNAVPVEFAGNFRWRATVTCYDTTCAAHWTTRPKKTLVQELRGVAFSS